MKLNVFYSWQSDLPNKSNRGFINKCLQKALKTVHENNPSISEYTIESDSRNETGTPDLTSTIFSKIDQCDIFVADISIINKNAPGRKVCNPNVLIELGYASSKIGWGNILSVYNLEYGKIEDLPFDIRHRKPIIYGSENSDLTKSIVYQVQSILDTHIGDKKYYSSIKREIDLSLQAILIDISKLLFFGEVPKCYNYNLILHLSKEELIGELTTKKFLGFQLFKNSTSHIDEFIEFFNDQVNINFLNEKEKNKLAKIILQFKNLFKLLSNGDIYDQIELDDRYALIDAEKMNPENTQDSYILVEKLEGNKSVVLDSGVFKKSQLKSLVYYYKIKDKQATNMAMTILELSSQINQWIRLSGGYFLYNHRLFEEQKE